MTLARALRRLAQGSLTVPDVKTAPLPPAAVADAEVMDSIDRQCLFPGIGYINRRLLVSARLTPDAPLWTADRHLHTVAAELSFRQDCRAEFTR